MDFVSRFRQDTVMVASRVIAMATVFRPERNVSGLEREWESASGRLACSEGGESETSFRGSKVGHRGNQAVAIVGHDRTVRSVAASATDDVQVPLSPARIVEVPCCGSFPIW
jgi:hypothetical protein